jgi:hypothetical protein
MNRRLGTALALYAVLIAIALFVLRGKVLYAVLLMLALLMAKTLIAAKAGWYQSQDETGETTLDSEVNHGPSSELPGETPNRL